MGEEGWLLSFTNVSDIACATQLLRFGPNPLHYIGASHPTSSVIFLLWVAHRPSIEERWRRRGDSNPRYDFTSYNGLANRRFQPLSHPSGSFVCICFPWALSIRNPNQNIIPPPLWSRLNPFYRRPLSSLLPYELTQRATKGLTIWMVERILQPIRFLYKTNWKIKIIKNILVIFVV